MVVVAAVSTSSLNMTSKITCMCFKNEMLSLEREYNLNVHDGGQTQKCTKPTCNK